MDLIEFQIGTRTSSRESAQRPTKSERQPQGNTIYCQRNTNRTPTMVSATEAIRWNGTWLKFLQILGTAPGDYPHLPDVSVEAKDAYYPYDFPEMRRNYQEPVSAFESLSNQEPTSHRTLSFRSTPMSIITMKLASAETLRCGSQWEPCGPLSCVPWEAQCSWPGSLKTRRCSDQ